MTDLILSGPAIICPFLETLDLVGRYLKAKKKVVGRPRRAYGAGESLPCLNPLCGVQTKKLAKGRCPACYRFQRRTGVDREPGAKRVSRRRTGVAIAAGQLPNEGPAVPSDCFICDAKWWSGGAAGRCNACYKYWRKHHVDRTKEQAQQRLRTIAPDAPCVNCEGPRAQVVKGNNPRCNRCASYFRVNGIERPPGELDRRKGDRPCATCKAMTPLLYGVAKLGFGECASCQQYRRLHNGETRPAELHGKKRRAPHTPTHCANPACAKLVGKGMSRNRCCACAAHLRANGVDRPEAMVKRAMGLGGAREIKLKSGAQCIVDRHPNAPADNLTCGCCGHQVDKGDRFGYLRMGRCRNCYGYMREHGAERPSVLWGKRARNSLKG